MIAFALLFVLVPALLPAQERVDLNMVHKIKNEAFNNSKVMETMHQLTDRYGPRLTNSKQFRAAGEWAVKQLGEWGIANPHLEKWAAGFPGWQFTRYDGAMVEPTYAVMRGEVGEHWVCVAGGRHLALIERREGADPAPVIARTLRPD